MWYPSQQKAFCHRYAPSQNYRTDTTRTSYYPSHIDDSSSIHLASKSSICKSETTLYYHRTTHVNSVNEMNTSSSTNHQDSPPSQWNPTISTAAKVPMIVRDSSSSSTWDWLIYSPALDAQLYHPTSSFISSVKDIEEDSNLLLNLPSWLLALLYPSNSINHDADDENDQELNALDRRTQDETLRSIVNDNTEHVSSSSTNVLILENRPNQKIAEEHNRSSTPDTDDGYQSASDASRSDCSHLQTVDNRKDSSKMNTTSTNNGRRISYAAAAVKPLSNSSKTKNFTNESQKNKFIAPRFERMHHAKQYSSTSTTTSKDSSFIPRTQSRLNQSTRRR